MLSFVTKAIVFLSLFLMGIENLFAQLPAKETNKIGYRQEFYGGLNIHTRGFGINFNYAKFATFKSCNLLVVEFVSLKHHKEVKSKGFLDENAKEYVFGKLYHFNALRLGYGKKITLASKLREKGVQVSLNFAVGPSIGVSRPVYLEVLQQDDFGRFIPKVEKYNPEEHNINNIAGRARGNLRFSEMKLHPGLYTKLGLQFEYGEYREFIRAIEIGIAMDSYYKRIPIMTYIKNPFLFPAVYLNLHLGSRDF
jgi:hypothetical protein